MLIKYNLKTIYSLFVNFKKNFEEFHNKKLNKYLIHKNYMIIHNNTNYKIIM